MLSRFFPICLPDQLSAFLVTIHQIKIPTTEMFKPISSVQICLSCFLLVTAGEKERMNQVDKKDCMQDGG